VTELPADLVGAVHPDVLYWPAEEPPAETSGPATAESEDRAVVLEPHEPILAGTFALYVTPEGGFVLVTETSQRGTEHHVMPAAMVKMAKSIGGGGGGPFGSMIRKMMGG
jgi:hypothetical protein